MPSLFASETAVGYARIAVERGLDRYPDGLTYAIPADLKNLRQGERVIVPLGRGDTPTAGYIIQIDREIAIDDQSKLKFIRRTDASAAALPLQLVELARWISSYYCAPIGMTLASMLPAAVKKNVGSVNKVMLDLGDPLPLDAKLPAKQRQVLEALANLPQDRRPIELHALMELAGLQTTSPIKRLIERRLLDVSRRTAVEAAWAEHAVDSRAPEKLSDDQERVIAEICHRERHSRAGGNPECGTGVWPVRDRAQAGRLCHQTLDSRVEGRGDDVFQAFSTHLLFGVTGSGKTEVYIRLIQRVLAQGGVALMLVPEISLTPQTGGRLIGRFPKHRVAVLHSGLTAAQRHQQWALVAAGEAEIVLGARSAVFAPVPDDRLGLIIVDEEHDGSYKQDQAPRYHGRDVAIRRAQLAECPVILGSATPSLESWHNATKIYDSRFTISDSTARSDASGGPVVNRKSEIVNRYMLHTLPHRAPGLRVPKVQVVDFRQQMRLRRDGHIHMLGPALETALARTLEEGGQALILLNRRGYASYIACPSSSCGWLLTCDHCDVTMVYHRDRKLPAGGFVTCHHCLSEQKMPALCPQCGKKISTFGLGTQRVEEELAAKFPQLVQGQTMLRIDSDTMHGSRNYHQALERFGRGEVKVLVGTQMISKGLDFPGVRLVGVINADTSINLPDFRAAERTFQLVSQVAGRCGRSTGGEPGLSIVQTFNASTPAIQQAAAHDYEGFALNELRERKRCGLPPFSRMVRVVVRDEDRVKCIATAKRLADGLRSLAGQDNQVRVRGPAACPIARIADKFRQQVEALAPSAATLQAVLARARSAGMFNLGVEMAIDVDPIALL